MLHLVSFLIFAGVFALALAVIIDSIRAELPLILKVLGVGGVAMPDLPPEGERRVRVIRTGRPERTPPAGMRAAA